MARTKNRGYQQILPPIYTARRWKMGGYIRLSREDLQKINRGLDDSNSVKNQRDILNDFHFNHAEEFESYTEYVDDGHTGTDTERESFQRLLGDVMNDQYCYQTSKKIRQVFDYKRRNGQYIGSFAPYGYIKDPANKHQLLVDTEAAETVKRVYSMLLQGSSKRAIALYLNEHGIPSPTAYRRKKGLPVSSAVADDPMWGARMIHEILTNPIYTGDLVQGRRRVKSYKVHQIEAVPEDEWVRVPDTRTSPKGREVHLFSGFLKCADCGKSITRSQSGKNIYYACSTYKNRSRTACTLSNTTAWRPPGLRMCWPG